MSKNTAKAQKTPAKSAEANNSQPPVKSAANDNHKIDQKFQSATNKLKSIRGEMIIKFCSIENELGWLLFDI